MPKTAGPDTGTEEDYVGSSVGWKIFTIQKFQLLQG